MKIAETEILKILERLIPDLNSLLDKTFYLKENFDLIPSKKHLASGIQYVDCKEYRDEFLEELINTIVDYVYSNRVQTQLLEKFKKDRSPSASQIKLYRKARNLFDTNDLQGDFSELLLFNLMQAHFNAVPVLRKMSITTNKKVPRHGADTIHLSYEDGRYLIYVGEAKTYGGLKTGLKKATEDVIFKHYENLNNELSLHLYENIPEEIEDIIDSYLAGTLSNCEIQLVCLISFDIKQVSGKSRGEIIDNIIHEIKINSKNIKKSILFDKIPDHLIPRINYILFPIQDMKELIERFENNF